jgi:hypothetical protein
MRKRRGSETDAQRGERLTKNAQDRLEYASEEDYGLDAAVRQSIKLHGA